MYGYGYGLGGTLLGGGYAQGNPIFIIMAGQSNAQGKVAMSELPVQYQGTFPQVQVWNGTAFESLNASDSNNNQFGDPTNCFGAEMSMAIDLANEQNCTVYLLKYAIGGTQLFDDATVTWNTVPVGEYFDILVGHVNNALPLLPADYTLGGFVWNQGEGDSNTTVTQGNSYLASWLLFMADMRSETGLTDLKFFWTRILSHPLGGSWQWSYAVRRDQTKYCYESGVANSVYMVVEDDLETDYPTSIVHFSGTGYVDMGRRYKNAIVLGSTTLTPVKTSDLFTADIDLINQWRLQNTPTYAVSGGVLRVTNAHSGTSALGTKAFLTNDSTEINSSHIIVVQATIDWTDPQSLQSKPMVCLYKSNGYYLGWRADSGANSSKFAAESNRAGVKSTTSVNISKPQTVKVVYNCSTYAYSMSYWDGNAWVVAKSGTNDMNTGGTLLGCLTSIG